jgi:hypothetical protein
MEPHLVVLGVGFYPIRKSCLVSFWLSMAAILGLQQRLFSKFRITTNGGQCIFGEIVLPIAKWELMYVVMLKRRKHRVFPCVGCGICAQQYVLVVYLN